MEQPPLKLAFFWHMHQPYYRDDESGVIEMPWVFLHALKDYYEMLWHLKRFPSLKATFNLSPALLEQLRLYENTAVDDRLLKLFRRPCAMLDDEETQWVTRFVRNVHYEHQVVPLRRYKELFETLNVRTLNSAELCEIEVLFLLSWCGNAIREEEPYVARLLQQSGGYDESQKNLLLDTLAGFVRRIVPEYRTMNENAQIALAMNPMYHPILPLLMDMKNALHSRPDTRMPDVTCAFEEDAYRHLEEGMRCFRRCFGRDPQGIWPSEGSVNETTLQAYERYGMEFTATDEEILFATLNNYDRSTLYTPYRFKSDEGIMVVFRDKRLSDKVGFHYARVEANAAAEDFMEELRRIYESFDAPVVSVILDGENAWEYYPENGLRFFNALYERLEGCSWCQTVHLDELAHDERRYPVLGRIHPGSWIYRDFSTWIGQCDKNRAWEMLCLAHLAYQRCSHTLPLAMREKIEKEFLIAEGSDWFWWYGTDHQSDYADVFDTLFRQRLIRIYRAMAQKVPAYLLRPNRSETLSTSLIPTEWVSPALSAEDEAYFEWYGSGVVHEPGLHDVMDTSAKGIVRRMRYGFDRKFFYLSLEGRWEELNVKPLRIRLLSPQCTPLEIELLPQKKFDRRAESAAGIVSKTAQLRIPLKWLNADETFSLQLEVLDGSKVVSRFPSDHAAVLARYIERPYDWYI